MAVKAAGWGFDTPFRRVYSHSRASRSARRATKRQSVDARNATFHFNPDREIIMIKYLLAYAVLIGCALPLPAADLDIKDTEGSYTDILHDGKILVRYMYARDESSDAAKHDTYKVYYHVYDPSGKEPITKGPGGKKARKHDHKHRLRTVKPYDYKDATMLLIDFWDEVDAVLEERGIRS